jgi:hypothetical protein
MTPSRVPVWMKILRAERARKREERAARDPGRARLPCRSRVPIEYENPSMLLWRTLYWGRILESPLDFPFLQPPIICLRLEMRHNVISALWLATGETLTAGTDRTRSRFTLARPVRRLRTQEGDLLRIDAGRGLDLLLHPASGVNPAIIGAASTTRFGFDCFDRIDLADIIWPFYLPWSNRGPLSHEPRVILRVELQHPMWVGKTMNLQGRPIGTF